MATVEQKHLYVIYVLQVTKGKYYICLQLSSKAKALTYKRYLSSGAAHKCHSVLHFHSNCDSSQLSLSHQQRFCFQGKLRLTGQRGRQELGSTIVPDRHVFLPEQGIKISHKSFTFKVELLPLGLYFSPFLSSFLSVTCRRVFLTWSLLRHSSGLDE